MKTFGSYTLGLLLIGAVSQGIAHTDLTSQQIKPLFKEIGHFGLALGGLGSLVCIGYMWGEHARDKQHKSWHANDDVTLKFTDTDQMHITVHYGSKSAAINLVSLKQRIDEAYKTPKGYITPKETLEETISDAMLTDMAVSAECIEGRTYGDDGVEGGLVLRLVQQKKA